MAARKSPGKLNKSEFVRSMAGAKPSEIAEAARKKGIKLTIRYIYVIRSSDKAKARKGLLAGSGRRGGRKGTSAGAESQLRRAIAELGLAASRRILEDVEKAFR